jgi:hypothetical protein
MAINRYWRAPTNSPRDGRATWWDSRIWGRSGFLGKLLNVIGTSVPSVQVVLEARRAVSENPAARYVHVA